LASNKRCGEDEVVTFSDLPWVCYCACGCEQARAEIGFARMQLPPCVELLPAANVCIAAMAGALMISG